MAILEDTFGALAESPAATGLAIGAGVLLLAPTLLPLIGRMVRPLAVGVIKTGMVVYNQTAATLREATEDIVAEARAELDAQRQAAALAEPERRRSRPGPAEGHA
jgi:hypothetical protein